MAPTFNIISVKSLLYLSTSAASTKRWTDKKRIKTLEENYFVNLKNEGQDWFI